MQSMNLSKRVMWAGVILILLTGLIHAIDTPGSFGDATYKGLLFVANVVAAVIAAAGIYRGGQRWAWLLGLLVAAGSILGYIISRTTGLPGMEPEQWVEPLGVVSLLVEGLFVVLAARFVFASLRTTMPSLESRRRLGGR